MIGLRLIEGSFNTCGKKTAKPIRQLWAEGSGRFQTMGRYATATTTRGARWLTADLCDRTLVRARQGTLLVADFVAKKKVVVKAPASYAAKPRRL
jgi:hypothetical protein